MLGLVELEITTSEIDSLFSSSLSTEIFTGLRACLLYHSSKSAGVGSNIVSYSRICLRRNSFLII